MSTKRAFVTFLLVTLVSSAALSGPVVQFSDGRTLQVQDVTRQDEMALLELPGGGQLSVPESMISNWPEIAQMQQRRPAASPASLGRASSSRSSAVMPAVNHHPLDSNAAALWRRAAGRYVQVFEDAAQRNDLDPVLLTAVAHVESRFDAEAISPKGAQGMLQLMPATAERFGVDNAFDVTQNVEAGAKYLSWLLERYEGRTDLALAGYNAGEQAVDRYSGVPPYSETRMYVTRVLNQVQRLSATR